MPEDVWSRPIETAGRCGAEILADAAKIRRNGLLHEIYADVYDRILSEVPRETFPRLLEVGSGGGFFRSFAGHATTSECVPAPGIDRVLDACRIGQELPAESFDAVVAFDVFHHLPDPAGFLEGLQSVLRPGGRLVLVEPWGTPLGQWFFRLLHHEPWHPDPDHWTVVGTGRISGANSRLPCSVFRDRPERFAREFPWLRIVKAVPFHKWLYLFSGGLRLNTRIPRGLARLLVRLDRRVRAGDRLLGLFALIVVERADGKAR
jgi:SAM-dependent methyltransferase